MHPETRKLISPHVMALAWLALCYERILAAFWPFLSGVALSAGLVASGLLPLLSSALHSAFLIVLALALVFAAFRGAGRFQPVTRSSVIARLEDDSGLAHQPLVLLDDQIALGQDDPMALALWQHHQQRQRQSLKQIFVRPPRAQMAGLDPYALRFPPVAILILGLFLGWGQGWDRLAYSLQPGLGEQALVAGQAELWITPPVYTGLSPIYKNTQETGPSSEAPIELPEGSTILVQTTGYEGRMTLSTGFDSRNLNSLGRSGSQQLEMTLDQAKILRLSRGDDLLFSYPLVMRYDDPPVIEFPTTPASAPGARLRIDYLAEDDYGVISVRARIQKAGEDRDDIMLELPLSRVGATSLRGRRFFNLANHSWAGLPVQVTLIAKDSRDQTVETNPVTIILPERIFNHPLARLLSESRKKLHQPTIQTRYSIVEKLLNATQYPKRFFDDLVVFLGLRVAAKRLHGAETESDIENIQQLLWDLALRIEDGEMVLAERDLAEAQDRLMEAMRRGDNPQAIEQLMQDFQRAMDGYLSALAQELAKRGLSSEMMTTDGTIIGSDEMQQLLRQAQDLAAAGDMDGAREIMAQLSNILDGMQSAMRDGQPRDKALSKARDMMEGLRDLSQSQEKLLDETFTRMQEEARRREEEILGRSFNNQNLDQPSQSRNGFSSGGEAQSEKPGDQMGPSGAEKQQALRQSLGELMRQADDILRNIPDPLGEADQAMRRATDALNRGDAGAAIGPQGEALQQMRDATGQLSEQIAKRMQSQRGLSMGQGRNGMGGRDPFGRNGGGVGNPVGTGIDIDAAKGQAERAQQILKELRKRSGERSRPRIERDYIDRLLRRF